MLSCGLPPKFFLVDLSRGGAGQALIQLGATPWQSDYTPTGITCWLTVLLASPRDGNGTDATAGGGEPLVSQDHPAVRWRSVGPGALVHPDARPVARVAPLQLAQHPRLGPLVSVDPHLSHLQLARASERYGVLS